MIDNLEEKIINKEILSKEEIYTFLDYIVKRIKDIVNDNTFNNKCDLVQGLIGRYLNKLEIRNYPNITNKSIMSNVVGHSFIVASINNKNYLIDPAYVQFLCYDSDYKNEYIGNLRIKSQSPYHYACEIDKEKLVNFIKLGYMELTCDNAYLYGTSFYKTRTSISKEYAFINIKGSTYINSFLSGKEELRDYGYEEINEDSYKHKLK